MDTPSIMAERGNPFPPQQMFATKHFSFTPRAIREYLPGLPIRAAARILLAGVMLIAGALLASGANAQILNASRSPFAQNAPKEAHAAAKGHKPSDFVIQQAARLRQQALEAAQNCDAAGFERILGRLLVNSNEKARDFWRFKDRESGPIYAAGLVRYREVMTDLWSRYEALFRHCGRITYSDRQTQSAFVAFYNQVLFGSVFEPVFPDLPQPTGGSTTDGSGNHGPIAKSDSSLTGVGAEIKARVPLEEGLPSGIPGVLVIGGKAGQASGDSHGSVAPGGDLTAFNFITPFTDPGSPFFPLTGFGLGVDGQAVSIDTDLWFYNTNATLYFPLTSGLSDSGQSWALFGGFGLAVNGMGVDTTIYQQDLSIDANVSTDFESRSTQIAPRFVLDLRMANGPWIYQVETFAEPGWLFANGTANQRVHVGPFNDSLYLKDSLSTFSVRTGIEGSIAYQLAPNVSAGLIGGLTWQSATSAWFNPVLAVNQPAHLYTEDSWNGFIGGKLVVQFGGGTDDRRDANGSPVIPISDTPPRENAPKVKVHKGDEKNNELSATSGPDKMTGGGGTDKFQFQVRLDDYNTLDDGDRITDYEKGEKISLEGVRLHGKNVKLVYDAQKNETRIELDLPDWTDRTDGIPDKAIILDGDQRGELQVDSNCCANPTTTISIKPTGN